MCMPLTLFSSRISYTDWRNALCYFIFSQCSWGTCFYTLPPSTLNRWYPWHLTLCQQKDLRVLLLILPINHLKFLMESTCSSIVNLPVHLFVVFVIFFYVRHSGRKAVSQIFQVSIIQFLKNVSFFSSLIFKRRCCVSFRKETETRNLHSLISKGLTVRWVNYIMQWHVKNIC